MDRVDLRRQVSESSGQSRPIPDNNLLRLKRISQSFEDLTSETLYSKWKKARKLNSAKAYRRDRSMSLSADSVSAFYRYPFPEEELDINGTDEARGKTNSMAATLQKQIFRPRGWTVCTGELSRDKEKGAANALNSPSDDPKDCLSDMFSIEVDGSTTSTFNSSGNLDDVFASSASKTEKNDTIEARKSKIITEIISGTSQKVVRKVRSLSDSDRRIYEVPSGRRRLIDDPNCTGHINSETRARSLSCREPREIEFLRTAEMAQRYLDNNKMPQEDVWQKRSSSGDSMVEGRHKRMSRSSVIHSRSEVNNNACNIQEASLGFTNDRSQPDASKRYVLGCTYALIRQPEPKIPHSNEEDSSFKVSLQSYNLTPKVLTRTMSEPNQGLGKKESRSTEEKERDDRTVKFKEVDRVTDLKGSHRVEGSSHEVKRAQTLPRMPKRPVASLTLKNWKDSEFKTRKTAEDLITNINNSNEKSAQERVDVVEKAFEWIRKEVADLRAQDKDIMRMFTKIQAGIRHIKFDRSSLMESEEEYISTPDLAGSTTSVDGVTVHRRASLL